MSALHDITARIIQDSRGQDTVECTVTLASGTTATASVPSGKSTGSHEVVPVPASVSVQKIMQAVAPLLVGRDVADQKAIDELLIGAAGEQKQLLGGNTTLAASVAVARAHALETDTPLWKYLRVISGVSVFPSPFPRPFVNLINGGAHTGNTNIFQEYILVPQNATMKDSLAHADEVRKKLGDIVKQKYPDVTLGDEGGFALKTDDPIEPFTLLREAAGEGAAFALDAAATESTYDDEARTEIFKTMIAQFPLAYIEDPFGEEHFGLFARFQNSAPGVVCVGDDLTTTNTARMEKAFAEKSITGVILKPNQIGTVSEALAAAAKAREYGWRIIASHRSGETEDAFIADFAYGVGADGIKIGTSVQKERWAKYDRLGAIALESNT
ncbi:MAG: enolase [Candidatus Campbellbacteria bacterium]